MSEQFATKHESVVQGATDRRERREVPVAVTSTRVRTGEKSGSTAGEKGGPTAGEPASHRAGRGRPGQDALPRRYCHGGADDPIYVADSSNQDEVEDAKKTVEVPQMHDIDKIVGRRSADTEEGLERPKEMNPWQRRLRKRIWSSTSTESRTYQWTKSLVMLKTPDHVAQSVTVTWKRSLAFLLIVLRRLQFKHGQLKTLRTRVSTSVERPHQVPT